MKNVLLITAICFLLIVSAIYIILLLTSSKDKAVNKSKNQKKLNQTEIYIPHLRNQRENLPVMTHHASQRMSERLGVIGTKQTELMNNAFEYGRTSDKTSGDLRIVLESAEKKYDEETIAKFYGNSIYIFTAEDNVLKTVYPFNSEKNFYH